MPQQTNKRGNPNWGPGKSGNPNGRPKDPFPKLIREQTKDGVVLIEKAMELLQSNDENIRFKALVWLSDRGWGKPVQPVGIEDGMNRIIVEFKK